MPAEEATQRIGARIAQARHELGATRRDVARALGIPLGVYERYETGEADATAQLGKIAAATDKPLAWFFDASSVPAGVAGSLAGREAAVAEREAAVAVREAQLEAREARVAEREAALEE